MRLPHPYATADLLGDGTCLPNGLTVFVAETSANRVVGLLAFDRNPPEPLMIGPLLPDEQLADLICHALVGYGLDWARDEGLSQIRVKVDLGEERGLTFFLNQGFRLLEGRQYILAARPGKTGPASPATRGAASEGIRFGPSPEMLSSEYIRLYHEIGEPLGWTERANWTRPQVFEHLQQPGVHLLAARAGETYLGFAELIEREVGDAELELFGLLPAFRGRGVGSEFMAYLLHHAFEQLGLQRVWSSIVTGDTSPLTPTWQQLGLRQERALVFLQKDLFRSAGEE